MKKGKFSLYMAVQVKMAVAMYRLSSGLKVGWKGRLFSSKYLVGSFRVVVS